MTPDAVLQRQIKLYRQMTGEQRLEIALNMHAFECEVARQNIRRQFPEASEQEFDQRLRDWIEAERLQEAPSVTDLTAATQALL